MSRNEEIVATAEIQDGQKIYQDAAKAKALEEKNRVESAIRALSEEEAEPNVEEKEAIAQETQEKPQEQEESKTSLYSRIAEQDYELQRLKKQLKQAGKQEDTFSQFKQQFDENPSEALQQLGVGPDQILDLIVNGDTGQTEERHEEPQENAELKALKEKLAALENAQARKELEVQVQNEYKRIGEVVSSAPEKWPIVTSLARSGSYEHVLETAKVIFQQNVADGVPEQEALPQYATVLDMVEEYYENNIEQTLKGAAQIDKFKHYFNTTNMEASQPKQTANEQKPKKTATVTSAMNDTAASSQNPSDEERKRNAIAALEAAMAAQQKE